MAVFLKPSASATIGAGIAATGSTTPRTFGDHGLPQVVVSGTVWVLLTRER
jgi:hypothetical protein